MKQESKSFHYSNKTIRIADNTWERLKVKRRKSGKTWNLYLLDLLKSYERRKGTHNWIWSTLPTLQYSRNQENASDETAGEAKVLLRVDIFMSQVQGGVSGRICKEVLVE